MYSQVDSSTKFKLTRLQVVLKTVERCNLACTYCYYFFGGDSSFEDRPPVVDMSTIAQVANFLVQGVKDLDIPSVQVIFHGGEPLMQKKEKFDATCTLIREAFANGDVDLQFSVQTNGTLLTDDWIALLKKHRVGIGISIDGPKEYNDKHRINIKKQGSYDAVKKGFRLLEQARADNRYTQLPSTITVLNPDYDYRRIYRHLAQHLNVRHLSFLLPDASHDSGVSDQTVQRLGTILCEIFDEWTAHPGTSVRNIDDVMRFFQKRVKPAASGHSDSKMFIGSQVIVIQSDGSISVDDSLIPASAWRNNLPRAHVSQTTLAEFFASPFFADIFHAQQTIPAACADCCWKQLCRGGDIENRFSSEHGFENKSLYCLALKMFFEHVASHLVQSGYPIDDIESKLVPAQAALSPPI